MAKMLSVTVLLVLIGLSHGRENAAIILGGFRAGTAHVNNGQFEVLGEAELWGCQGGEQDKVGTETAKAHYIACIL